MDVHKSARISIGTVIRNQEILKFVSNHLKTEKIFKMQLKINFRNNICS